VSFLLDTDICSAYLKGNGPVTNRFVQYGGRLNISTVTLGELLVWALRAKASPGRLQQLDDLLKGVLVLPVDEAIARRFGEVRAWQLDRGLATPDLDLLNASVALAHGLTLATHNTRDYANVPGLTLVDWLAP
jgi:predicted nucleic acid-binding protein